jgi:hypothetical protein
MPLAPEKFVKWLGRHEHQDPVYGWVYQYHPRSDAHSVALCKLVLEDLLSACKSLRDQALVGKVVYGINYGHVFPLTNKKKNLDLAIGIGTPDTTKNSVPGIYQGTITTLQLSCENKTAMTEHSKSQPRIFDELSSSHEIVHHGEGQKTIATGISVVNIANTFVSPLRQKSAKLQITKHKQPQAAASMINHLRGLPVRDDLGGVGFDAYATIVVNCNNQRIAALHTALPAPQPGDPDEYTTFISKISAAYRDRFGKKVT